MVIEALLISDAATSENGKLNILGAFDAINTDKVPVTVHYCSLALRARYEMKENGKHKIQFLMNAPSKKEVFKAEGEFEIKKNEKISGGVIPLVYSLIGFEFAEYGNYSIKARIDDNTESEIFVIVKKE